MKHLKTYEGLFDFFKKKKTIETPPVDISNFPLPFEILYEPITASYMVEYEDNHQTIPFTKVESDYIMGLAKSPSDVIYNSGSGYFVDHYRLKIGKVLEFIIRKYDDEWFFVTTYDPKIKGYDKFKYYKCDTFDGVKQLLYES